MCGICGKIYLDDHRRVTALEIEAMKETLNRRGPDEGGVHINGNVGLGHRRLSIIDIDGSHQPMGNDDGTVWIVYNGETYNFMELRKDLESRGHRFKTRGDTEVIVHLYEEYGPGCVERLCGMFAFAVWDSKRKTLLLARDRVGIKPLYYYLDDDVMLFGSELKAILADQAYSRNKEIDLFSLHHYFSFLCVPDPLSIFKGVMKLPPGHYLVLKDGEAEMVKYWDITFGDLEGGSEEDYCNTLIKLLEESVRIRLISDVPIGAFLSGGIDSSAVVAVMAGLMDQPVRTFSIGFSQDSYNEADDARVVANHFGTDHTEFILDPRDMMGAIPELLGYFDEPFADSSALPTCYVSKLARDRVTVVLSGDGGDELFGGYPWRQKRPAYQLALNGLPQVMKKKLKLAARLVPSWVKGSNFLSSIDMPYERYILDATAVFNESDRLGLYSDSLKEVVDGLDPHHYNMEHLTRSAGRDWTDRLMEYDFKTYLPNDILTKVDRMSMYNSLEVRVPILDHRFIEFAAAVPSSLKIREGVSKYIFKKALKGILPEDVLEKKKQGFSIPLEHWLRTDLRAHVEEVVLSPAAGDEGFFNMRYVEKMLGEFFGGDDRHNFKVWELYVFQLWYHNTFK